MVNTPLRAGIVGAGYIASWHADTIRQLPGVTLAAVCDMSPGAAQALADGHGAEAYTDLDAMIANAGLDAVHILTPPDSHRNLAVACAEAGLHVLVEKPVAVSAAETAEMVAAGQKADRLMAAGHNFLGMPGYERLKQAARSGALGRVSTAEINWCFPLPPLRSGPFGLWLMRAPRNLLLELGPHLFAFAVDLFGPVEVTHLELSKPIALPCGETRHQGWRVLARAGNVDVTFNISLVETVDDRSVVLRGSSAQARFDYAADTLVVRGENTADLILNPLAAQLSQSWQHLREGTVNAARQVRSLNRKSPYGLSFLGAIGSFYDSIARGRPLDARFDMLTAQVVMQGIDDALTRLPSMPVPARPKGTPKPTVMVIGGTGFIGRALTRELVARGHDVRVVSRGRNGPFPDLADRVETVAVSMRDTAGLVRAMQGIDTVFNLAKSMDKTWHDALVNDVGVSLGVAEAARDAGVRRLIYTGTIASYDMSRTLGRITEDTGFARDMSDRNMYARSKAECERRLMQMHHEKGLPLVIARPGIVVGAGGPLQHWGIGRWHGAGAVRIWGQGHNVLPFVLIDDVTDGLIRMMQTEGIEGQSYNLVGDPMMSARDYFAAIHHRLGARLKVTPGSLMMLFLADSVKHVLKVGLLRRKGLSRASLKDWKSRAHYTRFDNAKPKADLGWAPETDRGKLIEGAIGDANLFGF
ncbi:MAG: NAD-dependent epimerase/dehydratase family protein [Rhodobacteraceae bacterium]|nr:NAD-dependent epimerase/dehydratase family protein [Paracoccaceae bacterium]